MGIFYSKGEIDDVNNGNIDVKQGKYMTRDSKYVMYSVLKSPDAVLLAKPISKICSCHDGYLIYHYNTNCYTEVDPDELAIKEAVQLPGTHLTSSDVVVLDAIRKR